MNLLIKGNNLYCTKCDNKIIIMKNKIEKTKMYYFCNICKNLKYIEIIGHYKELLELLNTFGEMNKLMSMHLIFTCIINSQINTQKFETKKDEGLKEY